jgi:hypothetical protein
VRRNVEEPEERREQGKRRLRLRGRVEVGGGNDKGLALIPGPYTSQHGIVGLAAHANGTATRVGNGTMPGSSSETPSAWRTHAGSSVSIHAPSLTRTSRKTSNVMTSASGSTRMRWPVPAFRVWWPKRQRDPFARELAQIGGYGKDQNCIRWNHGFASQRKRSGMRRRGLATEPEMLSAHSLQQKSDCASLITMSR